MIIYHVYWKTRVNNGAWSDGTFSISRDGSISSVGEYNDMIDDAKSKLAEVHGISAKDVLIVNINKL